MPLAIFIVWRILLEMVAIANYNPAFTSPWPEFPHLPYWVRWDSIWYISIFKYGYFLSPGNESNVAFFPLFPLIWKSVATVLPFNFITIGLVLANIFALAAFITIYRAISIRYDASVALKTLVALAVFPSSFFLISLYTESLFLFLVGLFFLFLFSNRPVAAAIVAGIAGATRPTGILLYPTLLTFVYVHRTAFHLSRLHRVLLLLVPPIGLIAFMLYEYIHLGSPTLWLSSQHAWNRTFTSPLSVLYVYLKDSFVPNQNQFRHLFELLVVLFTALHLGKMWKWEPAFALLTFLSLLMPATTGMLTCIQRFVLVILPLFIIIAHYPRRWYLVYLFFSSLFLIYYAINFTNFGWGG